MSKNNNELSDIVIGEDIELVENQISNLNKKQQKQAATDKLIKLKNAIKDISFETSQKEVELKRAVMKLNQHPFMIAINKLKGEIRQNKNKTRTFAAAYSGGLMMVRSLGIKLDAKTLKDLEQLTAGDGK